MHSGNCYIIIIIIIILINCTNAILIIILNDTVIFVFNKEIEIVSLAVHFLVTVFPKKLSALVERVSYYLKANRRSGAEAKTTWMRWELNITELPQNAMRIVFFT